MTSSDVPTATAIGRPPSSDQGGHDEEAAAGADQTGDQADDQAVERGPGHSGSSPARCATRPTPAAPDHGDRGGQHHQGERDEQHVAGEISAEQAAEEGAGHAGGAEDQAGAPADPPGPGVAGHAGERGDPDDEQRGGDGLLGRQPGDVDQDRHGQDRAAAAEQAERDADQHGQGAARGARRARRGRSALLRAGPDERAPTSHGSAAFRFHGIFAQQHAHGAGVGQGGEGQAGPDRRRRPTSAGHADDCRGRRPATRPPATRRTCRSSSQRLPAPVDRCRRSLPGHHPAVEDAQAGQADLGEGLLGLRGAGAGAADEHDVLVEVAAQLRTVLAQGVQRHVVGPRDVGGLELRRGADVEDPGASLAVRRSCRVGASRGGRAVGCWSWSRGSFVAGAFRDEGGGSDDRQAGLGGVLVERSSTATTSRPRAVEHRGHDAGAVAAGAVDPELLVGGIVVQVGEQRVDRHVDGALDVAARRTPRRGGRRARRGSAGRGVSRARPRGRRSPRPGRSRSGVPAAHSVGLAGGHRGGLLDADPDHVPLRLGDLLGGLAQQGDGGVVGQDPAQVGDELAVQCRS